MVKTQELIKELQKNFAKLMELNDKALDSLPADCEVEKNNARQDTREILDAVREGNLTKLNVIKERYANINTK